MGGPEAMVGSTRDHETRGPKRTDVKGKDGRRLRWRSDMGVEPTQDESIAPRTVLKFASRLLRLPPASASVRNYPCK